MPNSFPPVFKRILAVTMSLSLLLAVSMVLGVSIGSSWHAPVELSIWKRAQKQLYLSVV